MKKKYTWTKRLFSDMYKIFADDQQIGKLKSSFLSNTSKGDINGKSYTFKTRGTFQQQTEIIDDSSESLLGEITYNAWMTKAFITINGRKSTLKYDNIWGTKWSILQDDEVSIQITGSSTSGKIISDVDNELLLLSGLQALNYYWQITLFIIIIAILPIIY